MIKKRFYAKIPLIRKRFINIKSSITGKKIKKGR